MVDTDLVGVGRNEPAEDDKLPMAMQLAVATLSVPIGLSLGPHWN